MSIVLVAILLATALAFAGMGIAAFVAPGRITAQFGVHSLTADGRNEVRAVYGGFGIALAVLLLATLGAPALRAGVCWTVAGALVGMASGRMISAVIDHSLGRTCAFYLGLELIAGSLLAAAGMIS